MTVLFGRTSTGLVVPLLVTASGELVIDGSSVMPHSLLDGSVHPDTIANSPSEGDVIIGVDQGAGVIRWDVLPAGSDGQVLTVQADGSLAWETPSGGGVVVQEKHTQTGAVASGTTTIPLDDTIPQNTEGNEFLTLAITPTNTNNKLVIEAFIYLSHTAASWLLACLFQDSTAGALAAGANFLDTGGGVRLVALRYEMTAGTTSATTFKIRGGGNTAGTVTRNGINGARYLGGVFISSLRIRELTP